MTWKVVQIHRTRYRLGLSLPYLDSKFLDDRRCGGILITTCNGLLSILFHSSYSCNEENKVKKKKKKERERKRRIEDTSTGSFFVTKVFSSGFWAKSLSS